MKTFSKTSSESEFIDIECTACGSGEYYTLWSKSEIPFVKCRNCGLVFQNPQPVQAELIERYDDEYFNYEIENEDAFFKLMQLGLEDLAFHKHEERILRQSSRENRKPVFMDVGCATGRLLYSMRERGWSVSGIEVCAQAARYGIEKRELDIHIGTIDGAEIKSDSVDVIHCSHLIEHLSSPDDFVAQAARILRPGGLFIVVTPDISGFQARLFGSEWRSAIADHMYLFSKKTLSRLLQKHGFKILKTASWGGLAAGTAPRIIKMTADHLVKTIGAGDVVSIMGMI